MGETQVRIMPRSIMNARKHRKEAAGQARHAERVRRVVQDRDVKAREEAEKRADAQRDAWKKPRSKSAKLFQQCDRLAQVVGADAPVVRRKLSEAKQVAWREDRLADKGHRTSLGLKHTAARSSKKRLVMAC